MKYLYYKDSCDYWMYGRGLNTKYFIQPESSVQMIYYSGKYEQIDN